MTNQALLLIVCMTKVKIDRATQSLEEGDSLVGAVAARIANQDEWRSDVAEAGRMVRQFCDLIRSSPDTNLHMSDEEAARLIIEGFRARRPDLLPKEFR